MIFEELTEAELEELDQLDPENDEYVEDPTGEEE